MGWERNLGYPVTDETGTPDGVGRFNHFSSTGNSTFADGSIYFTPATAAQPVRGAIRSYWAGIDWERGRCGYPIGAEISWLGYYDQQFEGGWITFTVGVGSSDNC